MKRIVLGIGLAVSSIAIASFSMQTNPLGITGKSKASAVELSRLMEEFVENEIYAEEKYKDQWIKVTGALTHIEVNQEGVAWIRLESANKHIGIQCEINGVIGPQKLEDLHLNKLITIVGCFCGSAEGYTLRFCEII